MHQTQFWAQHAIIQTEINQQQLNLLHWFRRRHFSSNALSYTFVSTNKTGLCRRKYAFIERASLSYAPSVWGGCAPAWAKEYKNERLALRLKQQRPVYSKRSSFHTPPNIQKVWILKTIFKLAWLRSCAARIQIMKPLFSALQIRSCWQNSACKLGASSFYWKI